MNESKSLKEEARRIAWRLEILNGRHGDRAFKRLAIMAASGFPERLCV